MSLTLLLEKLSNNALKYDLISCKNGFTIKENNVFVHSSRDPIEEAFRFITSSNDPAPKGTVYILWGMGLGYHAQMLIDKGYTVIGVEHRKKCIDILKEVFPLENLHAFITGDNLEATIFSSIASLPPEDSHSFIDLVMRNCTPEYPILTLVDKAKHAINSSNLIYSKLMDTWYCNILENLRISAKISLTQMPLDAFHGKKVVICSAGPSLKESLPHLLRLRKKIVLIAVDTALYALVEYGIIPDFVHAVDAKIHNVEDFSCIPDSIFQQIVLLADLTLTPCICEKPWKAIEFLSTEQPIIHPKQGVKYQSIAIIEYLKSQGLNTFGIQTGGSVANSSFHYAIGHGAEQVILIGQDLAYSNNRGHAVGTPYDKEYRMQTSRFNSIDNIHCHKIPCGADAILIKGVDGDTVTADPLLNQFRQWFEVSVSDPENQGLVEICLNASEQGAFFQGWNHKKLSDINFVGEDISPIVFPMHKNNLYELIKPLYQQLCNISLENAVKNKLHKEFFYLEYTMKIKNKPIDENLAYRKLRRIQKNLKKIEEAIL
ncbi:MAG: motility associated factor glycosyltransferase family protein [Brevinema sp.]